MPDGKTIQIKTEERDDYFNVDNIAYLQSLNSNLTTLAKMMFFLPTILTLIIGVYADIVPIVLFGVFASIVLFYYYSSNDGIYLGTLDGKPTTYSGEIKDLEQEFKEKSGEIINVKGEHNSNLKDYKYNYHFVIDNIVSIKREEPSYFLRKILAVSAILMTSFIILICLDTPGIAPSEGILISISGVIAFLLLIWALSKPGNVATITISNGEAQTFTMEKEDVELIIKEFQDY